MKRAGNIYDMICDPDNLRLAWYKAKKGKESKYEVNKYGRRLQENLSLLRTQLIEDNLQIGNYHFFRIYEPKERIICAASFPERVLHHAIMNVCHSVFESYQVRHSYATRSDKGQFAALEQAKINQKKYDWFCKLDIRKYFDSISHELLLNLLERRFKDKRLLCLLEKIISSYETGKNRGIPIGNLTSQYFANYFLATADHHLLEKINIQAYVRYMDDMVLWHKDKSTLIGKTGEFEMHINQSLGLEIKTPCINQTDKGLPFLGFVVLPDRVRLNRQSKQRLIKKMKNADYKLSKGFWSQQEYSVHVLPLIAFTRHAETHQLRNRIIQ